MTKAKSTSKKSEKRSRKRIPQLEEQQPESQPPGSMSGVEKNEATGDSIQSPERQGPQKKAISRGGPIPGIQGSDPKGRDFAPVVMEKTVIAMPLFTKFEEERGKRERGETEGEPLYDVIIDVSLRFFKDRQEAKSEVRNLIAQILKDTTFEKKATAEQGTYSTKSMFSEQYLFARLEESVIKRLVRLDSEKSIEREGKATRGRAIYHIWPDFEITKLTTVSITTVKADAARNAFAAFGNGIVWAVMDSGIDSDHLHFSKHRNLNLPEPPDPLQHRDFTALSTVISSPDIDEEQLRKSLMTVGDNEKPLVDEFGHGTHVAGIIAGELRKSDNQMIFATTLHRDENKRVKREQSPIDTNISGMAPKCKLVSLKVLDKDGKGSASNLIAAIQWIQEINGHGRRVRVHGVNMSVGYEYDPEWFACGQSPLCVEVDRLVKSGVVVVVAAGNTGYGYVQAQGRKVAVTAGLDLTINDPGNAELAITVGSTHREKPHVYGVSYFSSKGPTGDGRVKPDLLAPGEKIISCYSAQRRDLDPKPDLTINSSAPDGMEDPGVAAEKTAGSEKPTAQEGTVKEAGAVEGYYKEDSGTSMAAPHVSGVIAAFLSVRREFIGRPEDVKAIFLSTATDLKRERYFQGRGLVDLMRAIQSV
ncbi:MAG: S8 family peptidase [Gammaproteobacteria bacterium]